MAIKGELIDIKRPLKRIDGIKITKATYTDSSEYPIKAEFINHLGNTDFFYYTLAGFFHTDEKDSRFDLIYADKAVDEEWPKHTKKRNIVDFKIYPESENCKAFVMAKSDDGRLFGANIQSFTQMKWFPLPELPQD